MSTVPRPVNDFILSSAVNHIQSKRLQYESADIKLYCYYVKTNLSNLFVKFILILELLFIIQDTLH